MAKTQRDGRFYIIQFEDGLVTQGLGKDNALHMAADARAIFDDRHISSYVAQWIAKDCISVTVLPRLAQKASVRSGLLHPERR